MRSSAEHLPRTLQPTAADLPDLGPAPLSPSPRHAPGAKKLGRLSRTGRQVGLVMCSKTELGQSLADASSGSGNGTVRATQGLRCLSRHFANFFLLFGGKIYMTFIASVIFKCPFPGASTFTPSCGRHRRPSLEFFPSSQTQLRPHQTRAAAPPPRHHSGPAQGGSHGAWPSVTGSRTQHTVLEVHPCCSRRQTPFLF